MSVLWLLLVVGYAAYGFILGVKDKRALKAEKSPSGFMSLLTGAFGIVAGVGMILGVRDHAGVVIIGLLGAALCLGKQIMRAGSFRLFLKSRPEEYADYSDCISGLRKFYDTPAGTAVFRLAVGMGKWLKIMLYITLIGIPVVIFCNRGIPEWEAAVEQDNLRREYEANADEARMNAVLREARNLLKSSGKEKQS